MATITTHTLNSVDGSHAGGIPVSLYRLEAGGGRTELFSLTTDDGGRLSQDVSLDGSNPAVKYELVLETGRYFEALGVGASEQSICTEVVYRFKMPNPAARYHIPMMLAPNSTSIWWSSL